MTTLDGDSSSGTRFSLNENGNLIEESGSGIGYLANENAGIGLY